MTLYPCPPTSWRSLPFCLSGELWINELYERVREWAADGCFFLYCHHNFNHYHNHADCLLLLVVVRRTSTTLTEYSGCCRTWRMSAPTACVLACCRSPTRLSTDRGWTPQRCVCYAMKNILSFLKCGVCEAVFCNMKIACNYFIAIFDS